MKPVCLTALLLMTASLGACQYFHHSDGADAGNPNHTPYAGEPGSTYDMAANPPRSGPPPAYNPAAPLPPAASPPLSGTTAQPLPPIR